MNSKTNALKPTLAALGLTVATALLVPATAHADECVAAVPTAFGGINIQNGRIFRDATASTCGPAKAYPGIFNEGTTFNYETFTVENPGAAELCVTISFDPNAGDTPCGTNAHASAYAGMYNPAVQADNFLGDVGSSVTQTFAVTLPAATTLILAVTNTTAQAACTFSINTDLCSTCGDSLITGGEACDDGNLDEGDGCDSNCTITACGNGIATSGEACDDGNAVDGDGCDSNCTVSACGNGVLAGEEICDDGNAVDGDGCDSNCTITACGNGVAAGDEACDDGNAIDGDDCDSNCTISACGNGVIAGDEACDDGNADDGDGCEADCTLTPPRGVRRRQSRRRRGLRRRQPL